MRTGPPNPKQVMRIGAITDLIKVMLEECFPSVWVEGEISNLARPQSGHIYLTLKDTTATLRAVMFQGVALRTRFDIRDGQEVFARGRISVYKPRGEYQFNIEELQPKGIGALELALQQLKEKLSARGYFGSARKRPLPAYPRRVALIASATGAAIRDMLEILTQRWPLAEVIVRPSRVQGATAGAEIAAAIRHLGRLHLSGQLPLEAILIGRGGGSSEDLSAFNEEVVAHAIYESSVPIVSAIGHEVDVTIADMVADRRALTPSEAVSAMTPDQHEVLALLQYQQQRLSESMRQRIALARQRVTELAERRALRLPLESIRDHERHLDEWSERCQRAMRQLCARQNDRLHAMIAQLNSLNPLQVLVRGYTLTQLADETTLVRSIIDVDSNTTLRTRVPDGVIVSRVEGVIPEPIGLAASDVMDDRLEDEV